MKLLVPRAQTSPRPAGPAGFTLIEMLVVMGIIILLIGVGIKAFQGGSGSDGTKNAAVVGSGAFSQARNEAIMRQTKARVIIDTSWGGGRSDSSSHYLRRLTVAYLNPLGVDVNGTPVATSNLPVDPDNHPANWLQPTSWTVLPGNIFFDPNYSAVNGTNMSINFAGQSGQTLTCCYYEFSPNGQALSSSLYRFSPGGATTVTSTPAQFVLSTGQVDTSGNFFERNQNVPKSTCYGFVLFRMGNTAFFKSVNDITQPGS